MRKNTILLPFLLLSILASTSCRKETVSQCPDQQNLLSSYLSDQGSLIEIYDNGIVYENDQGGCHELATYYDPNFMDAYTTTDSGVYLITEEGELFPTDNDWIEDFEGYTEFNDLFALTIQDTGKHWNHFTLQSPQAKTVQDYVALRQCILDHTCTFRDNRIDLAPDPVQPGNQALKFTCVPPSGDMTTAKSSISSSTQFFRKHDDCWFEARFYIESGMPFTLVDFENGFFLESPGPRVTVRNRILGFENKFGGKLTFESDNPVEIPLQDWFTVKVHIRYSELGDGLFELWQDGQLLISTQGISLPTSNSIQDNLEVGVSASSEGAVMYVDDVRISDQPF